MAYGTPTDPVGGTVITVAYAVANFLDPIRALRAFTGGSDPPGSNYWLRSTSTSAVSWVDRAVEVLAALGFTPANKAGDVFTGHVGMAATKRIQFAQDGTHQFDLVLSGGEFYIANVLGTGVPQLKIGATQLEYFDGTAFRPVWMSTNDGAGSGLDADLLDGLEGAAYAVLNSSPAFTGTVSMADLAVGNDASVGDDLLVGGTMTANDIAVSSTSEVANLNAAALSSNDWHAGLTAQNTVGQSPTTSFVDVTTCSVTLDRNGTWLILATSSWTMPGTSSAGELQIVVNGVAQTPIASIPSSAIGPVMASTFATVSASNGHVAKLQCRAATIPGPGTPTLNNARIVAIWLAP